MKKRIFAILVVVLALMAAFAVSASAEVSAVPEYIDECGLSYYVQDGEAHVVKLLDTAITEVTVPASVQGYPVVSVKEVFRDNYTITKVTLPEGLRVIDDYAFYHCYCLQSINLPSTLTEIGDYAFYSCYRLSIDLVIPASVTSIGSNAFGACYKLASLSFEPGSQLATIGSYAFHVCNALTEVTIPASVTSIGSNAFGNCDSLSKINVAEGNTAYKDIDGNLYTIDGKTLIQYAIGKAATEFTIPEGVTSIGDYAFYSCTSLASIEIPEGVTSIGYSAFRYCTSLTSIEIPESVTSIGSEAFSHCKSLTSIEIPEGVTSIGSGAFSDCTSLTSVTLPEGVKYIYGYTFDGCTNLNVLLIPESVTYIDTSAIPSSTALVVYEGSYGHSFAEDNGYLYVIYDGVNMPEIYTENALAYLIVAGEAHLIKFGGTDITEVEVPAQVKSCPVVSVRGAFRDNDTITKVTLPEGLRVIDDYAFYDCGKLQSINLPSTLTEIGDYAFYYCYRLSSELAIPASVTSIGSYAFAYYYKLASLSFEPGSQLATIGYDAFGYCNALTEVTIPASVTSIGSNAFEYCSKLASLSFEPGSQLATIGYDAFWNCDALTEVTIPASVTSIGESAFGSCDSLSKINVAEGNTAYKDIDGNLYTIDGKTLVQYAIGKPATEFTIPEGVTSIGSGAFSYCKSLTSIEIPEGVTSIGYDAFSHCTSLTSIEIPEGVTSIGSYAFRYCTSLTSVTIPSSVQYIDYGAFRYCETLEHVIIKNGVQGIYSYAFTGCTSLRHLVIPESVTYIYTEAFSNATVLIVYEDSYAHSFALDNSRLYFVARNIAEVFGTTVSGKVNYSDGSAVAGAVVNCYYNDGVLLGKATTDAEGNYSFEYVELGEYTIVATDSKGASASTNIAVKRINAYEVYVSGQPNLTIKNSYTISGTASDSPARFVIADTSGNIISGMENDNGRFEFASMPNGTYVISAYTEIGFGQVEVTVFNGDVSGIYIEIIPEIAIITGATEILGRDGSTSVRGWIDVKLYSSEGNVIATAKTDANGIYEFRGVPCDSYFIVAKLLEIRPDLTYGYDRAYELSGYTFVAVDEVGTHTAAKIVLTEGVSGNNTIDGQVTAQGEAQKNSKVSLTDISGNEIANLTTKANGKFKFTNIPNGIYRITATTQSFGMATVTVFACDGEVYGDTHILVKKSDKIQNIEARFASDVPDISTKTEAERYRSRIAEEKSLYDGLSSKEKLELSEAYVTKLMMLIDLLASCEITAPEGIVVEGGSVVSGDEIANGSSISFTLEVEVCDPWKQNENGVETEQDHITNAVIDTIGTKNVVQYYEITMSKASDGQLLSITDVQRDTNSTGKFRITLPIPADQRGYATYTIVHVHNGEVSVLADLDDNPDTITIEVDKFSTFVLVADDVALSEDIPDEPTDEPADEPTDEPADEPADEPKGFFGIIGAIFAAIWKFILSLFGIK